MTYCQRMLSLFRRKSDLRPLENITSQPTPATLGELTRAPSMPKRSRISRTTRPAH